MSHYFLLWATGKDRAGIVSAVTGKLFEVGCNLEDSSMMRLGSEFGIFLIFTSDRFNSTKSLQTKFAPIEKKFRLAIGVKKITKSEAAFTPPAKNLTLVSVHGPDRPGIVYRVTKELAAHRFNITNLATHRTSANRKAGYILFIEGELPSSGRLIQLQRSLTQLSRKLKTTISVRASTAISL